MTSLVEAMLVEMAELKEKLVEVEATCVNDVITVHSHLWVDAPKPKEFKGL